MSKKLSAANQKLAEETAANILKRSTSSGDATHATYVREMHLLANRGTHTEVRIAEEVSRIVREKSFVYYQAQQDVESLPANSAAAINRRAMRGEDYQTMLAALPRITEEN
jgi:hypothetical protein